MKSNFILKLLVVACLGVLAHEASLPAADFELLVTRSPDPVVVNHELNFTIDVTNRAGLTVTNLVVTNFFPASAQLTYASNFFGGILTNPLVFVVDILTNNQRAHVEYLIVPTVLGELTNTTTVGFFGLTNVLATNVVVTRVVSGIADLAAGLTVPPGGVLSNDWTTYTVAATNFGPDAVPDVILTNQLAPALKLIRVNPTNSAVSFTNGTLHFSLGTLPANTYTSFAITVQPTNVGPMPLLAGVHAIGGYDTNTANNFATNVINVGSVLAGQLVASIVSTQKYNPQTGMMEQQVNLANTGTTNAVAARVIVQGLTNRLYNAAGTNDGNPFVAYTTNLPAAASVELLLEYFVPARTAVSNPVLNAVEVPVYNPLLPSGAPVRISRLLVLPSGRVLIEFPAETNRSYTVLYSADPSFTNQPRAAQPSVTAPADRVQWIDYGPPKTLSAPASTPNRFYQVILNP